MASSSGTSKHSASFGLVLSGKLKLKGDDSKPKKRKKHKHDDEEDEVIDMPEYSSDPQVGTGKLTTSGVVVMGADTDFTKELEVGDTLLVTVADRFRNTQTDESRVVNMVLGKGGPPQDRPCSHAHLTYPCLLMHWLPPGSLNIEEPFTCDLTAPTTFMFVKRKPDIEALKAARKEQRKKQRALEESSKSVTYKVMAQDGGGVWKKWKTVTERCDEGMTREDMLIKRASFKADRHAK
jgi:hypothetical protein